jgi:uncharacterized LabA/DUF88 family protein
MSKLNVLFIDGENFLHKINDALRNSKSTEEKSDIAHIKLNQLIENVANDIKIDKKIFYAARLHEHSESKEKSKELIKLQRQLKTNLEKQGFEFIIAGNVRAQKVFADHKSSIVFREKGVDVRIAVDLVSMACDGNLGMAILCSSDSDLQPAVAEVRKRDIEIIYLGFEKNPNKGLIYTTNRTILFRNSEIIKALIKVDSNNLKKD